MQIMFGKVHFYLFYCAANTAFQVGGGEDGNKASLDDALRSAALSALQNKVLLP